LSCPMGHQRSGCNLFIKCPHPGIFELARRFSRFLIGGKSQQTFFEPGVLNPALLIAVDKNINFGNLKWTLETLVHSIFGKERQVRLRPHYFPFTEPSAEVDVSCNMCGGKGCRICSGTGWLEILGAGMVDPNLYKFVNYDPEKINGFAFGMGIERIAMLKYGIDDLRLFFENDIRFLKQF